jgi:hypothetical protein
MWSGKPSSRRATFVSSIFCGERPPGGVICTFRRRARPWPAAKRGMPRSRGQLESGLACRHTGDRGEYRDPLPCEGRGQGVR